MKGIVRAISLFGDTNWHKLQPVGIVSQYKSPRGYLNSFLNFITRKAAGNASTDGNIFGAAAASKYLGMAQTRVGEKGLEPLTSRM